MLVMLLREVFSTALSQSFSLYLRARNLRIYCAYKTFNTEKTVLLNDYYIKRPERLIAALQLMSEKIDGKEVVAAFGLMKICLYV